MKRIIVFIGLKVVEAGLTFLCVGLLIWIFGYAPAAPRWLRMLLFGISAPLIIVSNWVIAGNLTKEKSND